MDDCRPHLLFLCHRIPYPPDKGDKIRSYHWWLELVKHFRVHLGAFVDDPADWAHVQWLQTACTSALFLALPRKRAAFRSMGGFISGSALTLPYYRDVGMQRWVEERRNSIQIASVLVFSSAMAQYVDGTHWSATRRVIDFVDVDSDKWHQYSLRKSGITAWVYRREADKLATEEARLARIFSASVFVSVPEAGLFRQRVSDVGDRVYAIGNGVDLSYFQPDIGRQSPFPPLSEPVVFTGAMDYWANIDAVSWFVREVWPMVKAQRPHALFAVVGSHPTREVEMLRRGDIQVTGRVPDVRPFLQHAIAVVAPMRIARGIQNKVLEAMAMACPVVVTSKGLEGIAAMPGRDLVVADDAVSFAHEILGLMAGSGLAIGRAGRTFVEDRYDWQGSVRQLITLIQGDAEPLPAGRERQFNN